MIFNISSLNAHCSQIYDFIITSPGINLNYVYKSIYKFQYMVHFSW